MAGTSTDPLARFERTTFTFGGITHDVYGAGTGPGVIVIHELPGITPKVAEFAQRVVDAGFTVAMPSVVGTPGRAPTAAYTAASVTKVCISKEFTNWATNRTSPVIDWLRALARDLAARTGAGVGAVGMCFSGGFALGMAVDDALAAPVCSQPSLPFAVGARRSRDLGVSAADLERVRARTDAGLCLLGLRFSNDRMAPAVRFDRLREQLGDSFVAVQIDSSPGNPHGIRSVAHSVLTEDFVDDPGHPTRAALDTVIDFFRARLQ
jgi:dienelactone hydrolase